MEEYSVEYKAATQYFLELVGTLSEADLDKTDKEGWSPRQVIHHMADSEAQSYARLRRLIAEPGTIIQGYNEEVWAENEFLGYKNEEILTAIAVIKAVRQSSLELLQRIPDELISQEGYHSESGAYSIKDWLESYINHPRDHANQIKNQLNL